MEPKKQYEISDEELNAIYNSGREATISFMRFLVERMNISEDEVRKIKQVISKDSHNSSKPPSTDPPGKKKKPESLRKKTGKKPGGQKGHKGSSLKRVEHPDETKNIRPKGRCCCGKDLSLAETINRITRQVFGIVLPKRFVSEYVGEVVACECGRVHDPVFPEGVTKDVQYGASVKSLACYLKHYGFISFERMQDFFSDICNMDISQGSFVNFIKECAEKLKKPVKLIKKKLISSYLLHCDETGFRINGSRYWLHTTCTNKLTYLFPHKNRGKIAMDEIGILPAFTGKVVHDHLKSYYRYQHLTHVLCNVHHLRELTFFEEIGEKWAPKMIKCLLAAKDDIEEKGRLLTKEIVYYRERFCRIISEGLKKNPQKIKIPGKRGRQKQSSQYNFLIRMKTYIDDVLQFVSDPLIPFDNNQGERDLRMAKIQQKVSGCFRSWQGAKSFCIIRSYLSSIRKNEQSVFKALASIWSDSVILPDALF